MEVLSSKTNIDFMAYRWHAYVVSAVLIIGTIALWFSKGEEKYGVDYKGGHEFVVEIKGDADSEKIRKALSAAKFQDAVVQSFEIGSSQYSIRVGTESGMGDAKAVRENLEKALKDTFPNQVTMLKTDYVGPTIGAELRRKGLIAIVFGLIAILIYISVRFEFAFALGAVVAVFHDVIVATGGYLLAGLALNGASLAAALTILGYSVNDTIVIFDRVREEISKRKEFDLVEVMNAAMNAMLSRTIITSFLTLASAISLLALGGGAVKDLSLFLVVGVMAGCYSTIFIAAPIAVAWDNYRMRKRAKENVRLAHNHG